MHAPPPSLYLSSASHSSCLYTRGSSSLSLSHSLTLTHTQRRLKHTTLGAALALPLELEGLSLPLPLLHTHMAYHRKTLLCLSLVLASLVSGISGNLLCEDLPVDLCAFSVSSMGSRCVLEKKIMTNGHVEFECLTSQVSADEYAEWVETDECVQACGLERMSVGISSDALVERGFAKSLCSSSCQNNCPNVVDLFSNLAAGEGVSLKQVCDAQAKVARREMVELSFASLSANTVSAWDLAHQMGSPTAAPVTSSLHTAPAPSPSSPFA